MFSPSWAMGPPGSDSKLQPEGERQPKKERGKAIPCLGETAPKRERAWVDPRNAESLCVAGGVVREKAREARPDHEAPACPSKTFPRESTLQEWTDGG